MGMASVNKHVTIKQTKQKEREMTKIYHCTLSSKVQKRLHIRYETFMYETCLDFIGEVPVVQRLDNSTSR